MPHSTPAHRRFSNLSDGQWYGIQCLSLVRIACRLCGHLEVTRRRPVVFFHDGITFRGNITNKPGHRSLPKSSKWLDLFPTAHQVSLVHMSSLVHNISLVNCLIPRWRAALASREHGAVDFFPVVRESYRNCVVSLGWHPEWLSSSDMLVSPYAVNKNHLGSQCVYRKCHHIPVSTKESARLCWNDLVGHHRYSARRSHCRSATVENTPLYLTLHLQIDAFDS